MSYARLPSRVSKANVFVVAVDFFRAMCDTEVSPKNPKSGPNVGLRSSPLMVWSAVCWLGQCFDLHRWMMSISLDDASGGQHCSQWDLCLCGPAGLDPQCHSERQHSFWQGVWWRKVRHVWFLSSFLWLCVREGSPPQEALFVTTSLIALSLVSFRYNSVLNSCCLRPDLAILPNSDLTEVQAFCPWQTTVAQLVGRTLDDFAWPWQSPFLESVS